MKYLQRTYIGEYGPVGEIQSGAMVNVSGAFGRTFYAGNIYEML